MSKTQRIPESLPVQFRAATVENVDTEKRTVTFALTSEQPVERWWGAEILDHKPGSIRQDRLKRGVPLLFGHDTKNHIGRIESYAIKDGKLTVTARFGNSALAEEKFRDVQDGILVDASGGYIVHGYQLESADDKGNETFRVTDWEPVEGSLVPIPADPTVGIGRDLPTGTPTFPVRCLTEIAPEPQAPAETINPNPAPAVQQEKRSMEPVIAPSAGAPAVDHNAAVLAERARVSEINALAERYSQHVSRDQAAKFINENTSADVVRRFVLDAKIEGGKQNEVRNLNRLGLSDKDKETFSFLRMFNSLVDGKDCFEMEVSRELAKKLGRDPQGNGVFVPMDIRMKRADMEYGRRTVTALDATASTAGKESIFTEYVSLIELLRNKMKVRQLGATVLSGLSDTIAFPKQASAGTATWVADNPGSDVADSSLTFGQISMSPKLLQSTTSFSRKLLLQSSVDVEALVRNDLITITALAIDLAAINGTGANNQPTGIFNQTGVGSKLTGKVALDKGLFVDLETLVAAANADIGTAAYLTDAAVRGKLKKTAELGNTVALPVWYKGQVNDYAAEVSQQMPTFAITTPSSYTGHGIIFGIWSQLMIGEWGALEVIVDPYRLKKQGMIEVTTFDTCDVNVRHAPSFAACNDADPTV